MKKKSIKKKKSKLTRDNLTNTWPRIWDRDNSIEKQNNKNHKAKGPIT
jgi:hypothetical protein